LLRIGHRDAAHGYPAAMLTTDVLSGPISTPASQDRELRHHDSTQAFALGPFTIDCASRQLLRNGRRVKIRPQVYEVLRVLATHCNDTVSTEELFQAWSHRTVLPHTVGVTISEVRRVLGDCGSWIRYDRDTGFSLRIPPSESLVRLGYHLMELCSRDGLTRALDAFNEASAVEPEDQRAFEGQANCYLLLSAFGLRPGWQVAPLFRNAHQRALELVGSTATLRCLSARAMLAYEGRIEDARAELERVLGTDPSMVMGHVCNAVVLALKGDLDAALAASEAALANEPLSAAAATSRLSVTVWRGDTDSAVTLGARVVQLHPFYGPARLYYGMALELSGDATGALEQYRTASLFMQQLPWAQSLEACCLAKMGRESDAGRIRDTLNARRRTEYVDPYAMARIHLALGALDDAFEHLSQAVGDGVGYLSTIAIDPLAEAFRTHRRFDRLVNRFRPA
jgi:DNA-binding winged helix-turn-helix (wHTH) protein